MITCHLKYVIDPYKLAEFEDYGRRWIGLVNRLGGNHHGYFLPSEGANNIAYAMFSFPSLADYEDYRKRMAADPECQEVFETEKRNRSILSYERSFMRPVLEP
ncbi:NIPSNAP family protein [Mesorhizobium sp. B2-1-3A]|uniref:NIPSNAP family protein n=1 Tax=Mesorhizobium sp. B2-1-3A TaxID=2589971 RepID=UPI00112CDBB1|nr:NIPSNAP family protein [Mesorhizobium sp. B2-1-3A]TPM91371.1 NIPSNAP family protein [Mesorhizobium sp. B2-1-3A]